jgi:hypothetical protein
MTALPAILTYDRNDELDATDMAAVLERSERMMAALRRHCAVALRACDETSQEIAEELSERLWTLVGDIPPPLPGGDRLTLNDDAEAIDTAWLEWRKELWAAEGQAAELRRRLTRDVLKLVPVCAPQPLG